MHNSLIDKFRKNGMTVNVENKEQQAALWAATKDHESNKKILDLNSIVTAAVEATRPSKG